MYNEKQANNLMLLKLKKTFECFLKKIIKTNQTIECFQDQNNETIKCLKNQVSVVETHWN